MKDTGERFIPSETTDGTAIEHWHRYASVLPFIKNKRVLDIASGSGYGSFIMADHAEEVVGIDIDAGSIEFAMANYKKNNLLFKTGSVTDIPISGTGIYDVIISFETIEHVNKESQEKFLSEIKRLLKSDGIFVVSTPNKKTYTDLSSNPKNIFHFKEFYLEEYEAFLKKYFSNMEIFGQKIYSASFIWKLNGPNTNYAKEYYLDKNNLSKEGEKSPLYFIAFCSDANLPSIDGTLLIDADNGLMNSTLDSFRQIVIREIDMMKNSTSWKITYPLRCLKKYFKREYEKS